MTSVPDLHEALTEADCVVIATDHSAYDWNEILGKAALLIDTRRAVTKTVSCSGQAKPESPSALLAASVQA